MASLDEIINESQESREVKRALSVKMGQQGVATSQVCGLLNVSPQYVSKWRMQYEAAEAVSLLLAPVGSQGYLNAQQRETVCDWSRGPETLRVEAMRDYVQEQYGVVYGSKQSYYELMHEAGWSYHKSEKCDPRQDQELVEERREEITKNSLCISRRSGAVR